MTTDSALGSRWLPAPAPTLWGAMLGATGLMGVVAHIVAPQRAAHADQDLVSVLGGVGFAMLAGAVVLSTTQLAPRAVAERCEGDAAKYRSAVVQAHVVRWALLEGVSVVGLLRALVAADPNRWIVLGVVALFGMLASAPVAARWNNAFEERWGRAP